MRRVFVRGVGMTAFGLHLERTLKDLAAEAVTKALRDAQLSPGDIDAVFCANAMAGLVTGQEMIRGETVVLPLGIGSVPIHNLENACASGGDALHLGWLSVAAGLHERVLVLGVEKANHPDRARTFSAYGSATDVEAPFEAGSGAGSNRTPFVDRQARLATQLMEERGLTREAFAQIAAKAHGNASQNPLAHRRKPLSSQEVLAARLIVDPITVPMSSPISDGAAAVVLVAPDPPLDRDVRIAASRSAARPPLGVQGPPATTLATRAAFEDAGLGPDDVDVAEVHDASVAYEVIAWSETGLCTPGDELHWAESGHTALAGPLPVNPSGGLIGRGHALGASGVAQVVELVEQLRGESGPRQVEGARIALAQVGGGVIDWMTAVSSAHILARS